MTPDLDQPLHTALPLRDDLPAEPLRAFLDAVASGPERVASALVFADWLDDQGDARGQAVRWSAWKDSHSRTSTTRRALAGKLHAWIEHYRDALVGTDRPGGTLEWHAGLLRLRINSDVIHAVRQHTLVPGVWNLITAGWIGEVGIGGSGTARLLERLASSLGSVPRLRLERCDSSPLDFLDNCSALRALHLEETNIDRHVFDSLRSFAHLEELTLAGCRLANLALFDMPRLRSVRARGCLFLNQVRLRDLPELTEFHLGGASKLTLLEFADLPALRAVTLAAFDPLDTLTVRDLPALERLTLHNFPLRYLRLADLPALSALDLRGAKPVNVHLDNLPRLDRLDLGKRPPVRELTGQHLPALVSLSLNRATELRTLVLKDVPALAELHLAECGYLFPHEIMALLASTSRLRKLDLRGIRGIGPVWQRKARELVPGIEIVR